MLRLLQNMTKTTNWKDNLRCKKSKPGETIIWPENAMADTKRSVPIILKSHYLEMLKEYCVSNFKFYGYIKVWISISIF